LERFCLFLVFFPHPSTPSILFRILLLFVSFCGSCINIQRSSAPTFDLSFEAEKGPRRSGLPPLFLPGRRGRRQGKAKHGGYGTQSWLSLRSRLQIVGLVFFLRSSGRRDVHLKGRHGMGLGLRLLLDRDAKDLQFHHQEVFDVGSCSGCLWASRSAQKG
jgi:hypothetical protein